MSDIKIVSTPQLEKVHSGKVRESFRLTDGRRLIVATDRISCFDHVLNDTVPGKGAVLTGISNYWFERTRAIIANHLAEAICPNAVAVTDAKPIRVEMIVRGYLAGSARRAYEKGVRVFSGATVPDGLSAGDRFPEPIVTPTTKEESDREITPDGIVAEGLASRETYDRMAQAAVALYRFAAKELETRGLILVDTKFEFGFAPDGSLILIDEAMTPDSSRFWYADSWKADKANPKQLDKEYVRQWLLDNTPEGGKMPLDLPPEVVAEASRRYLRIYAEITGKELVPAGRDGAVELRDALVARGLIRDSWVAVVMGSKSDKSLADRIVSILKQYGVYAEERVLSAHKNGERMAEFASEYVLSMEPGAVVAIAGRSNGLGGALAANLDVPVISCPPFADTSDYLANVGSSLMMPSKVPAMTVIGAENAAAAALRCLNLSRLRARFASEIAQMKADLEREDKEVRGERRSER
jgi:fusion protein PurCD